MTAPPAVPPPAVPPPAVPPPAVPPRVAVTVLASTEARLLTGTSTLWAGIVLAVALCGVWSGGGERTWAAFPANSGRAALILAAFLVLIGHLAASRDHRHGAAEFTATLPAPPRRRTVSLLAFLPVAAAAGALAECAGALIVLPSGPSGHFAAWLVAVPVLLPMIGAALGIAAGRWWPATPAGPLTLFAATTMLAMLPVLGSGPDDLPWLLFPVVLDIAVTGAGAGWHVLYLVAVLTVLVGVTLARHWRLRATAVVAVALLVAVIAVHRQQPSADGSRPAQPRAGAVTGRR